MLNLSETIIGEPHNGSPYAGRVCKVSSELYDAIIRELSVFLNNNYREITEENVADIRHDILTSSGFFLTKPNVLSYFSEESIEDFILKYGKAQFSVNFDRTVEVTHDATYELHEFPADLDINDKSEVYEWVKENSTGFSGDVGSDDQGKDWSWTHEYDNGINASTYFSQITFLKPPVAYWNIKSDEEWTEIYKDLGLTRFLEDYPKEVA